ILPIPMVVPILIYSSNKKDELLERWRFQYTIQERPYLTEDGKEKKYSKHDFIQSKTVKEAIQDGETTQSPS
ncbi:TPA: hypothetical protein TZM64_002092, partial [Streptococcus suis]|nr:hypothetical protein [Streptococcus suis]